jgi:hypothetical protein
VGGIGSALAKTLHLFLAPLQLAAAYQDRLAKMLDKVRREVPPERHTQAPPELAGPVLLNLRFIGDDNILKDLYLNLLTRAIDKDRQKEAHPGFVKIIEQLSPEEGDFLLRVVEVGEYVNTQRERHEEPYPLTDAFPHLTYEEISNFSERLWSLGIGQILVSREGWSTGQISFTAFGEAFIKACVPRNILLEIPSRQWLARIAERAATVEHVSV